MTERLRIVNYQPTPEEKVRLESEGITLAEILTYDQPSAEDFKKLSDRGWGLVDMILVTNVKANLSDAISQCGPLTQGAFSESDIANAYEQFLRITKLRCVGNPYPGREFSMNKAREFIVLAEQQRWTNQNIKDNLAKLREFLNQSTV